MLYTDYKYLAILKLTEDRDYVTHDELIHLLIEHPSNTVYIERDEILCGLITSGDIARKRDEKTRRVPFNRKFTSVHSEEHWRVRQIFRDKKEINALPVVSEDGHLLGSYVRWNDLIGTDYAELLCKDPYVLQALKENAPNTVFVKPAVRGGAIRGKMFSWWRHKLEHKGIHIQSIQHGEIKDYLNIAQNFLFVDEDEKIGAKVLNWYLDPNKMEAEANIIFTTVTDYLYRIKQQTNISSILKALQDQDVFVLAFDFKENNNQFLAELYEKIKKRNEEYGISPCDPFPEALREFFVDELHYKTYSTQKFPLQVPFRTQLGIPYLSDTETEFLHIQNGERLTVNQPEKYDRCIYLYGPCDVVGSYVSDQYTIASLLQKEINQAGFFCKVVNRGLPGSNLNAERLQTASFKQGDIVVLDLFGSLVEDFSVLNLTDALEIYNAPADWFVNSPRHCNYKANQVYAYEIYKELIPVLQRPPSGRHPVEQNYDYIDRFYLSHYFSNLDYTSCGTVGAVVMNCNPFTLGHRFLIEEALKMIDFLIIFVVEEDESIFSFQERFAMVCQGTDDLEHIVVVPSGPYILSRNTFPEYFQKISDEDMRKNTENDITLFAEKIAPKVGITYRFMGEEPEDKVTNEYNKAMKQILPRYGVQTVEIPRKVNGLSVISASHVRRCLSMNRLDELDELVPASTKRILFSSLENLFH